jgi:alpha-D-ribose 1-methylphosphonate 5-triphosphate synthase subunit PhnH
VGTEQHAPKQTASESQELATFSALMWAFSYPGRIQLLPVVPGLPAHTSPHQHMHTIQAIAEALIDLETSFFTPDSALAQQLTATGARRTARDQALYQFYPSLLVSEVAVLSQAPIGSLRDPDQSATLIIGCAFGAGTQLRLQGPGIAGVIDIQVADVPEAFWQLRKAAIRYPLGWDIVLVDQNQVIGLPRTTQIQQQGRH